MIASLILVAACSWDAPGRNPFRGDTAAAVAGYSDIPAPARAELQRRLATRQYDELAEIRSTTIVGKDHDYVDLRDMHFGANRRCATVTRNWAPEAVERGLVYCVDEHCIIVPTVCRNVSRVTRVPRPSRSAPSARIAQFAPQQPALESLVPEAPQEAPSLAPGPGFVFQMPAPSPEQALLPGPALQDRPSIYAAPFPLHQYAEVPRYIFVPQQLLPPVAPMSPVPEPASWALVAAGLGALAWRRR